MATLATADGPRQRNRTDPLQTAIATLIAEAEKLLKERTPPAETPDFGSRFTGHIPDHPLQQAILTPASSNPFIDAYVRWQLTDLVMQWAELDDRQLRLLLQQSPPLLENPRAEAAVIDYFSRAAGAGSLSPADLAHVRLHTEELDARTQLVQAFNVPALGFRDWVREKVAATPSHHLALLLENCHAAIEAGWPTRRAKARTTAAFTAAGRALSEADRRIIIPLLEYLAGRNRRFVNEITFLADGSVTVTYSTAGVSRQDVERWLQRLD